MSGRKYRRHVASLALLAAIALPLCAPAECQVAPVGRPKQKAESAPAPDMARWRYLLDDLAREARTLTQAETVPPLLAEVADAYWELDQARSRDASRRLAAEGIELIAPHRSNRAKPPTLDGRAPRRYRRRWKVEHLNAWFRNSRRIATRFDCYAEHYLGRARIT